MDGNGLLAREEFLMLAHAAAKADGGEKDGRRWCPWALEMYADDAGTVEEADGEAGEQYITLVSTRGMVGRGGHARLCRRVAMDGVVPRQRRAGPDALAIGCARGPIGMLTSAVWTDDMAAGLLGELYQQ